MNFLKFRFPGIDSVSSAFGTRLGGVSRGAFYAGNISLEVGDDPEKVLENRKQAGKELGFNRLIELRQVHGSDIRFEAEQDNIYGTMPEGDGAVVSSPGAAAMNKTADCQPIFLVHESGKYVCALHVGWRGNRDNFPAKAVRKFCVYYNIRPGDVLAVRGPSLGPCCAAFDVFEDQWSGDFFPYYQEKSRTMDLWSLTRDQLRGTGIQKNRIYSVDLCTKCRDDLFFSYRRKKKCGRQGNFIFLKGGSK